MNWEFLEEVRYRKRSAREVPTKLNHKHDWEKVMVYNPEANNHLNFTGRKYHYMVTFRCHICGMILPSGSAYAKENQWYYPIQSWDPPTCNLGYNYDLYQIDHPSPHPKKTDTYQLVKSKINS